MAVGASQCIHMEFQKWDGIRSFLSMRLSRFHDAFSIFQVYLSIYFLFISSFAINESAFSDV